MTRIPCKSGAVPVDYINMLYRVNFATLRPLRAFKHPFSRAPLGATIVGRSSGHRETPSIAIVLYNCHVSTNIGVSHHTSVRYNGIPFKVWPRIIMTPTYIMPPKPTCKVVKREGQRGARIDPKGCKRSCKTVIPMNTICRQRRHEKVLHCSIGIIGRLVCRDRNSQRSRYRCCARL